MLWLFACTPEPPPPPPEPAVERPDVLLVTIDTLRADRVGAYGDPLAATPALDAVAGQGVLFRQAHAVTPLTLPSHASILTGLLPQHHGLRDNAGFRLAEGTVTLARTLKEGGYNTAAFVSAWVLDSAWGLDDGFDTYRDPFHPADLAAASAFGSVELSGADVVNAAVAWWKATEGPRFAWLHLYDPHSPWTVHPDGPTDPYRSEVAYADRLLARMLRETDTGDLVVITSDHGEGLWDQGEREHGVLLGPGVTRVPLLVRPPGAVRGASSPDSRQAEPRTRRPGGADPELDLSPVLDAPRAARVVDTAVSGLDVAPTVADYAGLPLQADGRSLRPAIEGRGLSPSPVYAETWYPLFHFGWSGMQMAQDDLGRVERGARVEGDDRPDLLAFIERQQGEDVPRPGRIDGRAAEALAALGYTASTVAAPDEPPDPRDEVEVLGQLRIAEAAGDVGTLERLVAAHPDMPDALLGLSLARTNAGDVKGGLADTLALLQRWPDHSVALANGVFLAHQVGDDDRALALARRLQALNPMDARGFRGEAVVWAAREDGEQLRWITLAGLKVAPDDPNLHYLAGLAELQVGDPLEAVGHFDAARANGTRADDTHLRTAMAYEQAGRIEEARRHYDQALRENPDDLRPLAMGGYMLYRAGRCDEALPLLLNVVRRGRTEPRVEEALAACRPERAQQR